MLDYLRGDHLSSEFPEHNQAMFISQLNILYSTPKRYSWLYFRSDKYRNTRDPSDEPRWNPWQTFYESSINSQETHKYVEKISKRYMYIINNYAARISVLCHLIHRVLFLQYMQYPTWSWRLTKYGPFKFADFLSK